MGHKRLFGKVSPKYPGAYSADLALAHGAALQKYGVSGLSIYTPEAARPAGNFMSKFADFWYMVGW
jgi:hypothetical protein